MIFLNFFPYFSNNFSSLTYYKNKQGHPCLINHKEDKYMLDTYQVLSLLILFGGFIIALLTYIDRHSKK